MNRPVLVLEDEALIALSLEDALAEAGFDVAGPFASSDKALKWLARNSPGFAILDYVVADGECTDVVVQLQSQGIPFIVTSGVPRSSSDPADLRSATWITKPFDAGRVVEIIQSSLAGAASRRNSD